MTRNLLVQWSQIQRKISGLSDHLLDAHGTSNWNPNMDVCEGPDDVIVKLDLAGVPPENVAIRIEDQVLVIEGVRGDPYTGESTADYRFRQMEIEYGAFRRTVALPYRIDCDHARAMFDRGMLRIHLPRAQKPASRKIAVAVEP